jgi:hypothetical protein
MGSAVAGLFFYKFWSKTRDRLFALFAASFWILAFERCVLVFTYAKDETETWIYLCRLVAFLLIIAAVADKNRQ